MFDWLKGTLASIVTFIGNVIGDSVKWLGDLVLAVFGSIWDLFKDLFAWVLETMLGIVVSALSALDTTALTAFSPGAGLPEEITNVMALCGVGSAVGIITTAIGIRLVLQLIPFTRLGS